MSLFPRLAAACTLGHLKTAELRFYQNESPPWLEVLTFGKTEKNTGDTQVRSLPSAKKANAGGVPWPQLSSCSPPCPARHRRGPISVTAEGGACGMGSPGAPVGPVGQVVRGGGCY